MMHSAGRRAVARIDLDAIRSNVEVLISHSESTQYVADVSADGYGHGAAEIMRVAMEKPVNISDHSVSGGEKLYGLTRDSKFRTAMRVTSLVVGTKTVEAGEGVSYGYTWHAPERTNLALVGIGYADGLDRTASNTAFLYLGGAPRRIVGRVAMNALVLELGQYCVEIGEEAVVFGDPTAGEPAVWDWAASLGRPSAEIVSVFGSHLPRVYR